MRPKSNGKSLMISGFMCDCHGFLNVNWQNTKKDDEGNIIHEGCEERKSYTIINPGRNADGYWTNENLVQQLVEVIPLFEKFILTVNYYFALTILKIIMLSLLMDWLFRN
jgi:hypothetical protein